MSYFLVPSTDYRTALKKGMSGTDVAALQINLPVTVDGFFGQETARAVKQFQEAAGLEVVDGIAGQQTQMRLIVKKATPAARKYELPVGMVKSIASNESSFCVSVVKPHPSDAGIDIGPFQFSTGPGAGTQEFYKFAYSIAKSSEEASKDLAEYHAAVPEPVNSRYFWDMAGGNASIFKWLLSVLNHNWPAAAHNLPRYGSAYRFSPWLDDEEADWVVEATKGRLSTPRQWIESYVERATVYVEW